MKLLLDTHVFIWMDREPDRIPQLVRSRLTMTDSDVYLSVVSLWEIVVKQAIGKLELTKPLPEAVKFQQSISRLEVLEVTAEHFWPMASMPLHHKDPFDRFLIAQAIADSMTVVTNDPMFAKYGVSVLWQGE